MWCKGVKESRVPFVKKPHIHLRNTLLWIQYASITNSHDQTRHNDELRFIQAPFPVYKGWVVCFIFSLTTASGLVQ